MYSPRQWGGTGDLRHLNLRKRGHKKEDIKKKRIPVVSDTMEIRHFFIEKYYFFSSEWTNFMT